MSLSNVVANAKPVRYTGTKTLKAWPATLGEYNAYRGWDMPAGEDSEKRGYMVEYEDGGDPNIAGHEGYVSWSPADVFERTYHTVPEGVQPGIPGLPVAGYRPTQSTEAVAVVNRLKELEERLMREIDNLSANAAYSPVVQKANADFCDQRLLAIGRTQAQGAFMFLARAIFQPQRVVLPEDNQVRSGTNQ